MGIVRVADLPEHREEMNGQTFMTGIYYYTLYLPGPMPGCQIALIKENAM